MISVCTRPIDAAKIAVNAPTTATTSSAPGARLIERRRTGNHIYTGRYHRGRMDQCADRCRAFHRVWQPDVKRELRRLSCGAEKQKQTDRRQYTDCPQWFDREWPNFPTVVQTRREINAIEGPEDQHDRKDETKISHPVDDERFLPGIDRGFSLEPEADEQVRTQSDAFPADKHQQVVISEDQRQHEEDEQIQVCEVTIEPLLVRHISSGINVDQEANAGDDQNHQAGQVVQHESELCLEPSGLNPREVIPEDGKLRFRSVQHCDESPQGNEEGNRNGARSEDRDNAFRQSLTRHAVNRCTDQRQYRNQPEQVKCVHSARADNKFGQE